MEDTLAGAVQGIVANGPLAALALYMWWTTRKDLRDDVKEARNEAKEARKDLRDFFEKLLDREDDE